MKKGVKIFFPVDVDSAEKAESLISEVGPYVDAIKVGLELEKNIGTPAMITLAKRSGKEVFADVKLNDIPNTVKGAAKGLTKQGVDYFNVMALGGEAMMAAAVEGAREKAEELGIKRPKIIAVTILTSLNFNDLNKIGIKVDKDAMDAYLESDEKQQEFITEIVMALAELAINVGVDCVLSSPLEALAIHERWSEIDIFTPGIRMPWDPADDQKRKMTPGEAVKAGVRNLVIGRSIRTPSGEKTREEVITLIREDIDNASD